MMKYILQIVVVLGLVGLGVIVQVGTVRASSPNQFVPPTSVTLEMYALDGNGAIDKSYAQPECLQNADTEFAYGCTFYDGTYEEDQGNDGLKKAYPFGETYTITIGYESHSVAGESGVEFGYIHNVISQEMTEGSPLAAYTAQAIAAARMHIRKL